MVLFNDLFLFSSLKEPIIRKEEWDLPVSPGYGRSCRSLAGQSSEDPRPHSSRGAWFAFSPSSPCFITSCPPPSEVISQPLSFKMTGHTRALSVATICPAGRESHANAQTPSGSFKPVPVTQFTRERHFETLTLPSFTPWRQFLYSPNLWLKAAFGHCDTI